MATRARGKMMVSDILYFQSTEQGSPKARVWRLDAVAAADVYLTRISRKQELKYL